MFDNVTVDTRQSETVADPLPAMLAERARLDHLPFALYTAADVAQDGHWADLGATTIRNRGMSA
jgi:hypothetical protein